MENASWDVLALQKLRCYNGILNTSMIKKISDEQLLEQLKTASASERDATAHLIVLLAEMDSRRLYLAEGHSSLFTYCTQCLHLSEHAAYGRIAAARVARKFPIVLEFLRDGSINLTTVSLLASHLTSENSRRILEAARHKSKRDVEQQVAALAPKPDVALQIRRVPVREKTIERSVVAEDMAASKFTQRHDAIGPPPLPPLCSTPPVIAPIAPERYRVQVTINAETHQKLRRVQDLLRHVVSNGDPAVIFDRALTLLLHDLEKRKFASVERPRDGATVNTTGRHVPAAVRRAVWARDAGCCAFVGRSGRCAERGFLEFHHVIPFAEGGSTSVENLQLRCRAHNAYEAEEYFGGSLFRERSIDYQLGPDRVE